MVVFAGPPRYGGDFRSWRGIAPRLQTPRRGKLPSENSPLVRGGFGGFGGGSEGSAIIRKPLASPPVRGGVQYCSEGRLGDGQKELFFVCVTQFWALRNQHKSFNIRCYIEKKKNSPAAPLIEISSVFRSLSRSVSRDQGRNGHFRHANISC